MGGKLQISVGDISEPLRPVLFALAALASACVLASARRRFSAYAAAAWTLLTLLFPPVILPLYIIARLYTRPHDSVESEPESTDDETDEPPQTAGGAVSVESTPKLPRRSVSRPALPLLYLAAVLLAGALYFYRDYKSFDAHFARARQATLYDRRASAIKEYRAALALRDDAQTHKLLGLELAAEGRFGEALAEFDAAERGDEQDEKLPYHKAVALDRLDRHAEAAAAYRLFLHSAVCARQQADPLCGEAQARLGSQAGP